MANNCFYEVRVKGKEKDVLSFAKEFQSFGRIYSADPGELEDQEENKKSISIIGDCAWSVQSAILDRNDFQQFLNKTELDAEIFSSEPGIGFMEHYVWKKGDLVLSECVDYEEYYIDDLEDEIILESLLSTDYAKQKGITRDNYADFANEDGYIIAGGFDWDFEI